MISGGENSDYAANSQSLPTPPIEALYCQPIPILTASPAEPPEPTTSKNPLPEIEESKPTHQNILPPGQRCACGCVPNIMSLFEMAALREKRKAELKKQQEVQKSGATDSTGR